MHVTTKLLSVTALAAVLATLHPGSATAAQQDRSEATIPAAPAMAAAPAASLPAPNAAMKRVGPNGYSAADIAALRRRIAARGRGAGRIDVAQVEPIDPSPAELAAPIEADQPSRLVTLSNGTGQLIRLPGAISNVFISNDAIADVQMKSPTQLYLFAKSAGTTTVYATDRGGRVVWSTDVRVGNNIGSVAAMLRAAMPEDDIRAVPLNGMLLLQGTVLSPKDAEEAQRLVESYTANAVPVLNRLKIATPQQVMLQVKIAEVSRAVGRNIGVNLANRNGRLFVGQGNPGTITTNTSALDPATGAGMGATINTFKQLAGTTLGLAGRAFGADFISTLQLYENNGLVTTLAEPNLVALSGETATFLAGGEIPIPQSEGLGAVSVIFKQYGVSLAFTPIVLSPGRISLRVRPEVSQLSDANAVQINGFSIPALLTRRADTTVELGSGQSFVIGGLLQNTHNNSTSKAPLLGDLPIIGALFRSNAFRKDESELLIVVTPYIVHPVDADQVTLPTDGYRSARPADRVLADSTQGRDDGVRPKPVLVPTPSIATPPAASPKEPS